MNNYEKLKTNFIKNDFILLSHGINLCLFVYDWDDENTESKEKILEDLDKKISSYINNFSEASNNYLNFFEIKILSEVHDLAIEKAGVEEYHTLTGHDFSEALALQEKLHAYLAAMKQAEE